MNNRYIRNTLEKYIYGSARKILKTFSEKYSDNNIQREDSIMTISVIVTI